ncbi:MAG: DUF11 domain-containing protein [Sulfuriflexus sp.]|nr:DUF11 domain-containing protein [Sulfuriflexus sp.]
MLSIRHSLFFSAAIFLFWSVFTSTAHAFGATECAANRLGGDLVCTAADVSITGLAISGGAPSCVGGTSATFDLDLTVNSATPNRYDIGVFISNDGKDPQLTLGSGGPASCTVGILPPNDPPFRNLDPGPVAGVTDVCGDVNGSMNGGTGIGTFTMTNVSVACQSIDGSSGNLYIPFVVSWDNTAGTTCTSSDGVFPNTKSKCNSPTVLQSTVPVVVLPTITKTDNSPVIFSGDDTTYTVVITNTTGAVLSGAVFKDPAVTNLDVESITCSASGGATCPTPLTITDVQGGGVTLPDMPIDSSITFTIDAELEEDVTGTLTNIAYVTVGGQTNSDSDIDTILDPDSVPKLSKTDNRINIAPGATTDYFIVIDNSTDKILQNAVFKDPAVTDLTVNSITCFPSGGAICPVIDIAAIQGAGLTIPDMPDEGSLTFTINATLAATATLGATITNTASITAGGQTNFASDSNTIQNGAGALTCGPIPSTYPVYSSGDDLEIEDDVKINVGSGNVDVEEGENNGTAIDVTGTVGDVITPNPALNLPTIDPLLFPSNIATNDVVVSNNTTIFDSATEDTYDTITIEDGFETSFTGGGPFYIDELKIGEGSTVNLAAGNYFINKLSIKKDSFINITSEVVNIYINDEFKVNGDDVTINDGGNVGGLVIYLYSDADFKAEKRRLDFTGVIYGPDSDDIKFGKETKFHGAVIGGDDIEFDDDSVITYTPADAAMVGNISTCMISLDHYEIFHTGTGISCKPNTIRITGHDSGDNAVDVPAGTTITLSTSTNRGDWTLISTGTGTLTNGTLGDGVATYTFPGAESVVGLEFNYTNPFTDTDTVNFNVTDGTISESEDPDLVYQKTKFIFEDTANSGNFDIPTQISGKDSNEGFGAKDLFLRAITASDKNPAVCIGLLSGAVNIDLGAECANPTICAARQLLVNSTAIATTDEDGSANASAYTTISLDFDDESRAPIILNYPDAGQLELHARYNLLLANNSSSGDFLRGSNLFVVRPLALRIPVTGNNAAQDSDGDTSFVAGTDFNFTVEGVLWQQTDDTNEDGIADGFNDDTPLTNPADITDNAVTPNFFATASLSNNLFQPAGGTNPPLSSTSVVINNLGTGAVTANWPEVGIIEINAQVTDYLSSGQDILGRSSYVGRFYPDRFDVTTNTPILADSCTNFSYMDQEIGFSTNPAITITAFEAGTEITKNYDFDGFWKYSVNLENRTYTNNVMTPATIDSAPLQVNIAVSDDENGDGDRLLTISNETILYQRPADPRDAANMGASPAIPFDADINLNFTDIDLTDSDGVCYDSDNDGGACETYSITNIGSTEVRFGRLKIDSAFGSELVPLQLPITIQYYASLIEDFITVPDDTCTTLTAAPAAAPDWGDVNLSNYQGNLVENDTTPSLSALTGGQATLTLSAPLIHDGSVLVTLDAPPYLKFDWDGDGNHDNNPTALGTFGIYSGNNSTIYLRELY